MCCDPWHCRVRHNLRTEQQQQQTYLKNISEIIYINKVIWKINVWNIFNLLGFSGHKQYNINKLWLISIKGNWLENYLELPEWMSTAEGNIWKKKINYSVSGVAIIKYSEFGQIGLKPITILVIFSVKYLKCGVLVWIPKYNVIFTQLSTYNVTSIACFLILVGDEGVFISL